MARKRDTHLIDTDLPVIRWVKVSDRVLVDPALRDDPDRSVYRYASIAEMLKLVTSGEWAFVLPSLWKDKYERHVSSQLFGRDAPFSNQAVHVKCFSLEYSSEAMWRTYAGNGGLVRLCMKLDDLLSSLEATAFASDAKIYVGRVRYMDERALRATVRRIRSGIQVVRKVSRKVVAAALMKRLGFSYENEVRVCCVSKYRDSAPDNVLLATGLRGLPLQSVLIDPYLPAWEADELGTLLTKKLGVTCSVKQSEFDKDLNA